MSPTPSAKTLVRSALLSGALLLAACGGPEEARGDGATPAAHAQAASTCAGGSVTDVFPPPPPPQVDLLICLAPSEALAAGPEALKENFRHILRYVAQRDVDTRLAVVMPDGSDERELGRLRAVPGSGEQVLTSDMPDLEDRFMALVDAALVEARGDGRCFAAIERALEDSSTGLLREGAFLSVLAVTDLREGSDWTATEYLSRFYAAKGFNRRDLFTFTAVAGFGHGCAGDDGRYAYVVEQTKGLEGEICHADWSDTVTTVGKGMSYPEPFRLSQVPDLRRGRTLQVRLTTEEGRTLELPQVDDGHHIWRYDSIPNALILSPGYAPGPEHTLSVTYSTWCEEG